MKPLLDAAGLEQLTYFARTKPLVAFDFDGTLAPIVSDRNAARMRPPTRALFLRCCEIHTCAVITGRSRSDVASRLEGAAVRHIVGNHGADLALTGDLGEREMATVRDECRRVLGEDVEIEDKGNSLSLHYRHASDPSEAKRSIEACLASLSVSVRVVPGIMVYNVSSEGSPNKGTALVALLEREKIERAIFVGDDFTDEDAFASLPPEKLLSVRVGWRGTSSARYFLEDQADIDAMLEAIVGLQG